MGVTSYAQELTCPISLARMFKALFLDSHNLVPKLMPRVIKNIDIIKRDGGEGSIKQINFSEASRFKYVKHRIDEVNKKNFACKYTLIQGDVLGENLESITYEIKFEAFGNGGCVCKMISEYHSKVDAEINEEEIKTGKDKAMVMYKVVEAYLLQNPHVYV